MQVASTKIIHFDFFERFETAISHFILIELKRLRMIIFHARCWQTRVDLYRITYITMNKQNKKNQTKKNKSKIFYQTFHDSVQASIRKHNNHTNRHQAIGSNEIRRMQCNGTYHPPNGAPRDAACSLDLFQLLRDRFSLKLESNNQKRKQTAAVEQRTCSASAIFTLRSW